MSLARIHRESAEGLYRSPAQVNVRAEDGRRVTVHGFRATFKDWCEDENNFPSNHVEECLSHAVGNKTEQAYRRRTALKKRRTIMEKWAHYCECVLRIGQ
jgi:integrase